MLEQLCKADTKIAVVSNNAVDVRDDIIILDASNNHEIWRKDYYQFKAAAVYEAIVSYFVKKAGATEVATASK